MNNALTHLQAMLTAHQPADEREARAVALIQQLAEEHDILSQYCQVGHVTGSALVVDVKTQHVLLHFHKKLERWLQFGGHMDDDEFDPAVTAYRESVEESGLSDLVWLSDARHPLDIDVHTIPARGAMPEHYHLDFRYVLATQQPTAIQAQGDESGKFRWLSFYEVAKLEDVIDPALHRLIGKARKLIENPIFRLEIRHAPNKNKFSIFGNSAGLAHFAQLAQNLSYSNVKDGESFKMVDGSDGIKADASLVLRRVGKYTAGDIEHLREICGESKPITTRTDDEDLAISNSRLDILYYAKENEIVVQGNAEGLRHFCSAALWLSQQHIREGANALFTDSVNANWGNIQLYVVRVADVASQDREPAEQNKQFADSFRKMFLERQAKYRENLESNDKTTNTGE